MYLLHDTLLAPRIIRRLLNFWKTYGPLEQEFIKWPYRLDRRSLILGIDRTFSPFYSSHLFWRWQSNQTCTWPPASNIYIEKRVFKSPLPKAVIGTATILPVPLLCFTYKGACQLKLHPAPPPQYYVTYGNIPGVEVKEYKRKKVKDNKL